MISHPQSTENAKLSNHINTIRIGPCITPDTFYEQDLRSEKYLLFVITFSGTGREGALGNHQLLFREREREGGEEEKTIPEIMRNHPCVSNQWQLIIPIQWPPLIVSSFIDWIIYQDSSVRIYFCHQEIFNDSNFHDTI